MSWLRGGRLARDERGFVLVDDTLQSVSHPGVFAAGDCATLQSGPVPKSGVYALRAEGRWVWWWKNRINRAWVRSLAV